MKAVIFISVACALVPTLASSPVSVASSSSTSAYDSTGPDGNIFQHPYVANSANITIRFQHIPIFLSFLQLPSQSLRLSNKLVRYYIHSSCWAVTSLISAKWFLVHACDWVGLTAVAERDLISPLYRPGLGSRCCNCGSSGSGSGCTSDYCGDWNLV